MNQYICTTNYIYIIKVIIKALTFICKLGCHMNMATLMRTSKFSDWFDHSKVQTKFDFFYSDFAEILPWYVL